MRPRLTLDQIRRTTRRPPNHIGAVVAGSDHGGHVRDDDVLVDDLLVDDLLVGDLFGGDLFGGDHGLADRGAARRSHRRALRPSTSAFRQGEAFLDRPPSTSPMVDQGGRAPIRPYPSAQGQSGVTPEIALQDPDEADLDVLAALGVGPTLEESSPGDEIEAPGATGLGQLVLGRETVTRIVAAVPGLAAQAHLHLAIHTVLGMALHESIDRGGNVYRRVAIPAGLLARIEGERKAFRGKNYRGLDFLEAHREALPAFAWKEYQRPISEGSEGGGRRRTAEERKGYPRQVEHHGLPDDVLDLLQDDLLLPLGDVADPVFAIGGGPYADPSSGTGAWRRTRRRERIRAEARRRSSRPVCRLQGRLLDHLNAAPPNGITRLVNQNAGRAIEAVAMGIADPAEYLRALAAVRLAQLQPQPFYAPSKRGRTVRVFPIGHSLLALPGLARRAFMTGCLEVDLTCAHLAILARHLDLAGLLGFLYADGEPRKAWPLLFEAAGLGYVEAGDAGYDAVKAGLKEAVYALLYGMSERGLLWTLTRSLGYEAARRFLSDPLVRELLVARDAELARIARRGWVVDYFGDRHPVRGKGHEERLRSARSVLSVVAQTYELALLEPVIEAAIAETEKSQPDFRIVAWQHDGCTLTVRRHGERVRRRLEGLVAERAAEMGIPTRLESEWLL